MRFIWRSWRTDTKGGVSGWDPLAAPNLMGIWALGLAVFVFLYSGSSWFFAVAGITLAAVSTLTCRYHLVVSAEGYRLWRMVIVVIPWYVHTYSQRAYVHVEDDWGVDMGPCIVENQETFAESMSRIEVGTSFGIKFDCQMVVHTINALAFEFGCTNIPPGVPPDSNKEANIAVPNMTRRMRWRRKATHEKN